MSLLAKNLRFGHKNGPDFEGISLEMAPGSLGALLGPNGAGKSTLLRVLAGLHPLRGGRLSHAGRDLTRLSRRETALRIAYVPQTTPETSLTVYETLLLGRTPHMRFSPSKRDRAAVEAALERLELTAWRDRPLPELSGGERRKVLLGLALAQETAVLLLDEPAGSLDLRRQMEIYALLRSLCREEGKIVLVCEHDLNLAGRYSGQVAVLHQGGIKASGSPLETLKPELLDEVYGIRALVRDMEEEGRAYPHIVSLEPSKAF
ncbi:MAG: ABC transporter ATP-binding protein [Deltaproteobacteria bacterium]|jgi:iron complex transport system ATP-binding protein|nr:ABC transporter ATP-binding protein [Deltaproteobacteria bacterium]